MIGTLPPNPAITGKLGTITRSGGTTEATISVLAPRVASPPADGVQRLAKLTAEACAELRLEVLLEESSRVNDRDL